MNTLQPEDHIYFVTVSAGSSIIYQLQYILVKNGFNTGYVATAPGYTWSMMYKLSSTKAEAAQTSKLNKPQLQDKSFSYTKLLDFVIVDMFHLLLCRTNSKQHIQVFTNHHYKFGVNDSIVSLLRAHREHFFRVWVVRDDFSAYVWPKVGDGLPESSLHLSAFTLLYIRKWLLRIIYEAITTLGTSRTVL